MGYSTREQRQKSVQERFWEKVNKTDTCWLWTAATTHGGHGAFAVVRGKSNGAHRIAYEWLVGPLAPGVYLDHLCRVPACVNPAHLEPVTNGQNVRRGFGPFAANARKTHCKRGHEFTPANTYIDKRGNRNCRACARAKYHRLKRR